jgi:antitoxin component YwqK of YwqJK toxin-antitoxin module
MTITGYKIGYCNGIRVLITLEIPENQPNNILRSGIINPEFAKYRCKSAYVAEIEDSTGNVYPFAKSRYYSKKQLTYYRHKMIKEPFYTSNPEVICGEGIHFFLNKEQALHYGLNSIYLGTLRKWSPNGSLRYICNFIDGKKNGVERKWHTNDYLESEINYFNDVKHGSSITYYKSGQIKERATYKFGRTDGEYFSWYSNGAREREFFYEIGKRGGISREYYLNGALKTEANYKDGKLNGYFTVFSPSGVVIKEYLFSNDLTVWKRFNFA